MTGNKIIRTGSNQTAKSFIIIDVPERAGCRDTAWTVLPR